MPVRRRVARNIWTSSAPSAFAAHWRWFFKKICTAPQPTARPRSRARCRPPAMDMWAPISSLRVNIAATIPLCYCVVMDPFAIPSTFTTTFALEYGVSEVDMRRLYENAKRDQWNATRDIPWADAPSPDGRVIADELVDIYGSPLWDRLPETDRVALNRHVAAWRLSVLMHGEQGAMLACSQMVDIVPGADGKLCEASEAERRELEDYTCFALEKTLLGFFPLEAYQDAGFSPAQIDEAKRYRRETAASNDYAPFRKYFKRDLHGSMVANLARLGLLTDRVRPRLEKLGVTLPAS